MILAIDPSSTSCGVCLLSNRGEVLDCRALRPPQHRYTLDRVLWLHGQLEGLITLHRLPSNGTVTLATEHLVGSTVRTATALDFVILHLRQWARAHRWQWAKYTPQQWRQVAQIAGAAAQTKNDVLAWALLVRPQLAAVANEPGGMDAIEAFGIGMYHQSIARIERAGKGRG